MDWLAVLLIAMLVRLMTRGRYNHDDDNANYHHHPITETEAGHPPTHPQVVLAIVVHGQDDGVLRHLTAPRGRRHRTQSTITSFESRCAGPLSLSAVPSVGSRCVPRRSCCRTRSCRGSRSPAARRCTSSCNRTRSLRQWRRPISQYIRTAVLKIRYAGRPSRGARIWHHRSHTCMPRPPRRPVPTRISEAAAIV